MRYGDQSLHLEPDLLDMIPSDCRSLYIDLVESQFLEQVENTLEILHVFLDHFLLTVIII